MVDVSVEVEVLVSVGAAVEVLVEVSVELWRGENGVSSWSEDGRTCQWWIGRWGGLKTTETRESARAKGGWRRGDRHWGRGDMAKEKV